MTDEELENRVIAAVNRARGIWFVGMLAMMIFTALTMPWTALLWFIPIGVFTYALTLRVAAVLIAAKLSAEEIERINQINQSHAAGTVERDIGLEQKPAIKKTEIKVTATPVQEAGPVVGTWMGKPIHEYIMVKVDGEKSPSKFTYHGPARTVDGVSEIPVLDGMLFACANGILYSLELDAK